MHLHHHGPSLRYYLNADLYRRTEDLLAKIEADDKASRHAADFVEPLKQANAGYMAQKTAQIGMASVAKIARPIIRKLIGGLNDEQLKSVCAYVRQILH